MNLNPEDPRITAYVLGELTPEEAAAVESAAAADPLIEEKIREVGQIQRFLKDRLPTPAARLLPHQRENIRRNARQGDAGKHASALKSLQPWVIPAAAAAVLALATFILIRMPEDKPAPVVVKTPAEPTPAAKPAETPAPKVSPAPIRPAIANPGMIAAAEIPIFALPVLPGKSNLSALTRSIVGTGQLPQPESVQLDEILNSFPLRLNGTAAIARGGNAPWHPDNRDSGISAHVATVSTEMIACPWKPSATLLLISIRANGQKDCEVKIAFHANPENVARYRLLGHTSVKGTPAENPPARLPAGSYTTLAVEIESSKPGAELGTLEWSADDKPAPTISLRHKTDAEPSDDARFATLVCTYSQWLAREQPGIIDTEIVAALARETASAGLPPDRADFLKLIEKSLHL